MKAERSEAWQDRAMTGDGRWLEYAMDVVRGTGIGDVAEDDEGFNRFKSHAAAPLVVAQAIEAYGDKMVRAIEGHAKAVKAVADELGNIAVHVKYLDVGDAATTMGAVEFVGAKIAEAGERIAGVLTERVDE
jgi:hypothetical protein